MKLTDQPELSSREKEIIHLISEGKSREQIAKFLGISKLTYDSHRKHIRNKLNIKTQADWMRVIYSLTQSNQ